MIGSPFVRKIMFNGNKSQPDSWESGMILVMVLFPVVFLTAIAAPCTAILCLAWPDAAHYLVSNNFKPYFYVWLALLLSPYALIAICTYWQLIRRIQFSQRALSANQRDSACITHSRRFLSDPHIAKEWANSCLGLVLLMLLTAWFHLIPAAMCYWRFSAVGVFPFDACALSLFCSMAFLTALCLFVCVPAAYSFRHA